MAGCSKSPSDSFTLDPCIFVVTNYHNSCVYFNSSDIRLHDSLMDVAKGIHKKQLEGKFLLHSGVLIFSHDYYTSQDNVAANINCTYICYTCQLDTSSIIL